MSAIDFAVVVCTYNRAGNLPGCIEHLAAQRGVRDLRWEILVVDNNSDDDTAEVVRRLQASHPGRLRYVFEPEQGVAHARNRGIRETDGCHILYVDDDVRVTPDWLAAVRETFATTGCDAIAGRILVHPPTPLPRWITDDMMGFLGQLDLGEEPRRLDGALEYPFAGNMAIKRAVVERVGVFDTSLGRRGNPAGREGLYKGEEPELFGRLAAADGDIRYAPRAVAVHHILAYQLQRRFFLTIHYNEGYQRVRDEPPAPGRTLMGVPLYLYVQTLRAFRRYLGQTLRHGPNGSMRRLMTAAYFLGRIRCFLDKRRQQGTR